MKSLDHLDYLCLSINGPMVILNQLIAQVPLQLWGRASPLPHTLQPLLVPLGGADSPQDGVVADPVYELDRFWWI